MRIRVLLFGAPGLVHGSNDSDIRALQPKRAAVLAYLLVARSGPLHRRDTLLSIFWPEYTADRGRNALSKVVHHLRRSLGPDAILTVGDQIGVSREHVWCDVTAFEEALSAGQIEDALALYRGDLLQGFHISGSADFEHWSEIERGRLRRRAVESAWELASLAETAGDGARATKFARQAVVWAPRDESGLRRFLTLLHSRGHRGEALEAFEAFSRNLRDEYDIDPSEPTLDLIEAIRDGTLPYGLAASPMPDPDPASPPGEGESPGEGGAPEPGTLTGTSSIGFDGPVRGARRYGGPALVAIAAGLLGVLALSRPYLSRSSVANEARESRRVLVTAFDDRTEEELATVVAEALRVDLGQSRSIDPVERSEIVQTLELMGLESSATISRPIGREVAVRDGIDALVDGTVAPAGAGYIITAAIRAGADGSSIRSFRESAEAPDGVIAAIDRLSLGIREALGETAAEIRASAPLERVTTSSLEALTLYSRAVAAFQQFDDRSGSAALLERAVRLDPGFAMAWRKLAVAVQDDPDQTLRIEAARQAYHHRERLTELERHIVEASYYNVVEVDRRRAAEALRRVLSFDPGNALALNNLGVVYLYMGDLERAEAVFEQAVSVPRVSGTAYRNLVDSRLYLGRIADAATTLGKFERAYPDHELLPSLTARVRFHSGSPDKAKEALLEVVADPIRPVGRRTDAYALLAQIAYWEGRFEEGRSALIAAESIDGGAEDATSFARWVAHVHLAALMGDTAWARTRIETRLAGDLPSDGSLDRDIVADLTEAWSLTDSFDGDGGFMDDFVSSSRIGGVHARIHRGDTVGVRKVIRELPLPPYRRVLLVELLGDTHEAIGLYEEMQRPGFTGWGSPRHLARAAMRLGPLYEQAGDTTRAIEAYSGLSQRWADGDRNGRAVAERFSARALALEAVMASSLR